MKKIHHYANDLAGEQHAGLDGGRRQFFKDGLDLLPHDSGIARLEAAHAPGILRGDAGNGAGPMHAEGGERLQIRLNSRPAAAVRAGDGEGDRKLLAMLHGNQFSPTGRGRKLKRDA